MAIRYDAEFSQDIKRVVSNFNRKIARLEKKGRELLPDRVTVRELKESYDKRYELKRKLKELQRFSQRGVEEVIKTEGGVKTTKYALENLKRDVRRTQYRLTLERKKLENLTTPYAMTKRGALNLVEARKKLLTKDLYKMSRRELETIRANITRVLDLDNKAEQFQGNILQILYTEASFGGASESTLSNIEKTLAGFTPEQFMRFYYGMPYVQALMDYYPGDGKDIPQTRMKDILEAIEQQLPLIQKEFGS